MMFQQARETVVKTCINLAERRYVAGTGGNMALRAGEGHMLVTPSGVDYYTMGPGDICVIRLSDHKQVEGEMEASVEAGMHARVLAVRPDCLASVHTHQPIASAYSLLAVSLIIENLALRRLLGTEVPCVAYAPSGTGLLARKVEKAFNPTTHACLMRNHGVTCVGTDIDEALSRVAALESACADFFRMNQVPLQQEREQTGTLIRHTLQAVANHHRV